MKQIIIEIVEDQDAMDISVHIPDAQEATELENSVSESIAHELTELLDNIEKSINPDDEDEEENFKPTEG